jgi:hypothetical protein
MKGTNLADIEAAERHWAECLNFEHLEVLRIYRNKSVAHSRTFLRTCSSQLFASFLISQQ